jgi:hypothetical protein
MKKLKPRPASQILWPHGTSGQTVKFLKARLAEARDAAVRLQREVEYLEHELKKRGVKRP